MFRLTRRPAQALAVLPLLWWGATQANELTLQDRIEAQQAIEQVYWAHRIWPSDNPGPKPPLSAVMPEPALRARVEGGLAASARLEARGGTPLRGEDLQSEIDRMARDSKSPEVLRELFTALRDDPVLIAECLARPLLTERRAAAARSAETESGIDASLASEESGASTDGVEPDPAALAPPEKGYRIPDVPLSGCVYDTWSPTAITGAPVPRESHTAVWTGAEMIVFGGQTATGPTSTGARYDPATDSWTTMVIIPPTPQPRLSHCAVWTGTEMLVWGGAPPAGGALNTGARYNPATSFWAVMATVGAPSVRTGPACAWSGTELLVWGGFGGVAGQYPATGGRYNPSTNSWNAITTTGAPTGRYRMSTVWTGAEMIVWGGAAEASTDTGGRYAPATDSWLPTSMGSGVPPPSVGHTAVWTGSEMIVFPSSANPVRRYSPTTDSWVASGGAPGRQSHTAVWTGFDMIVWGGGVAAQLFTNTGARYVPAAGAFTASSLTTGSGLNVPLGRRGATAVYTGAVDRRMIVWGGVLSSNATTDTGGLYCAADCDNGFACSDQSVCTTGDACTLGHCSGAPVNCADTDFCTLDTCDAVAGCQHACTASCIPGEIAHLGMGANETTIVWDYTSGGAASVHDLVRGRCDQLPVGSGASETCLQSNGSTFYDDVAQPPTGRAFWYDVRGRHPCGAGPYGTISGGAPRSTSVCP